MYNYIYRPPTYENSQIPSHAVLQVQNKEVTLEKLAHNIEQLH